MKGRATSMANSYVDYTGDGSTTIFNIPFGFLDRSHIYVLVDGVETPYSWLNDASVSVTPAPANAANVRVTRVTPSSPVVDFRDGEVFSEEELDTVNLQSIYLTQESSDNLGSVLALAGTGQYDVQDRRIQNLADPVDPADAVSKQWAETAGTAVLAQAISARDAAATYRDQAEAARDAAVAVGFDPDSYYDKTAVDSALATKASLAQLATKADQTSVDAALAGKADQASLDAAVTAQQAYTDARAITHTTGAAPYFGCRAWVRFNGEGGAVVSASGNVSNVTRLSTGRYRVTFTVAMSDANYAIVGAAGNDAADPRRDVQPVNITQTYFDIVTMNHGNGAASDSEFVGLAVFR